MERLRNLFFFTFDFFLYCLAREILPECKKLKKFFLQILVLITLISNFNYKNQEKIIFGKIYKTHVATPKSRA
jgi:hypothetical protein